MLSAAYIFEQPSRKVDGADEKLRRENDWTSREVAQFRDRLIGFCGLNPLKDYALDELKRCVRDPNLQRGLKLHFGNSVVDFHNPRHIEQVRRVFRAANEYRMTIVVHLRASVTERLPYGRDEALIFLNELMPAAPDVVVQVAHLAGAGPWEDEGSQQAFAALAEAVAKRDARTRLLYFDVTTLGAPATPETAQRWAEMIRQFGSQRVVFGSDASLSTVTPGEAGVALRTLLAADGRRVCDDRGERAPLLAVAASGPVSPRPLSFNTDRGAPARRAIKDVCALCRPALPPAHAGETKAEQRECGRFGNHLRFDGKDKPTALLTESGANTTEKLELPGRFSALAPLPLRPLVSAVQDQAAQFLASGGAAIPAITGPLAAYFEQPTASLRDDLGYIR